MKVIIAGTRPPKGIRHHRVLIDRWNDLHLPLVYQAVEQSEFLIQEVVSGKAQGFDYLGEVWAVGRGIPIMPMPAKWTNDKGDYNRQAGFERNSRMAAYADALIAIWDGSSHGTADMILKMKQLNKPWHVLKFSNEDLLPKAQ